MSTLRSTISNEEVQVEVEALAEDKRQEFAGNASKVIQVDCFFEHGHWWVRLWDLPESVCDDDSGEITWSVVDGPNGLELEDM